MASDPTTNAALRTEPVASPEQPSILQAADEDFDARSIFKAPALSSKARALRPGQDVRIAWILLLLDRGPSYGYALTRELDAYGLDVDSPATYRLLRRLDDAGWVSSTWAGSALGPRRRSYELTAGGRHALRELATIIAATRDTQDRFLRAYAAGSRRRPPLTTLTPLPAVTTRRWTIPQQASAERSSLGQR
jgi:PadR family transcriptional regulator PadR